MERAGGLEGQFRWVVEGCVAGLWCFLEMCAHEEVRLEVWAIDYVAGRGQVQACQLFLWRSDMRFLEVRWLCLCVFDFPLPDERVYASSAGVGGFTLGFHMLCVGCECPAGYLLIHGWAFRFTPGRCAAFQRDCMLKRNCKF